MGYISCDNYKDYTYTIEDEQKYIYYLYRYIGFTIVVKQNMKTDNCNVEVINRDDICFAYNYKVEDNELATCKATSRKVALERAVELAENFEYKHEGQSETILEGVDDLDMDID